MAPDNPPHLQVVDPLLYESHVFCQTAVRIGVLSQMKAQQVLDQQRADVARGYKKAIFAYLQEQGALTTDQIAAVWAAQKHDGRAPTVGAGLTFFERRSAPLPLRLSTVFPIKEWLADRPWALQWVQWFAFFAFFPFVIYRLFDSASALRDAAWALGIYYHLITGFVLYLWLRPPALPVARILGVAAATVVLGVALVLYGQTHVPIIVNLYDKLKSSDFSSRLFGFIFGVGLLEEAAKALPVMYLFLYKKQPVNLRECAFLAAVSGLGFGVAEAPLYLERYARLHLVMLTKLVEARQPLGGAYALFLVQESLRLISLPLLHALWATIMGFFVGMAASLKTRTTTLLATGLILVSVLHGLYDALGDMWGALPVAMTFLVFIGYVRSGEKILERLQAEEASPPQASAPTGKQPIREGEEMTLKG